MANKKNQHFLPQFYFRNFSSNKKTINLILRKSGEIINGAPIKGQCSKSYFYGNKEIEDLFSTIEGDHSSVLKKILLLDSTQALQDYINNFDPIIDKDIQINPEILNLLQIILFQRSRTEYEAKKMSITLSKTFKEILLSHAEAKKAKEILEYKDDFDIVADEQSTVLMLIKYAFLSTPGILDLGIYILKNETNREFIFSDSPVVFFNLAYKNIKKFGVLGLQSPGLLIFFPISPNTCLLLIDEQKYQGTLLGNNYFEIKNKFDIDSINKLQIHHSMNSVYFSDNISEKYIKQLWRQQKSNFVNISGQFNKMDTFDKYGKKDGEILHMYQEQLPYEMHLSFLQSIDLSHEIKIPNYRNKELIDLVKESMDNIDLATK